MRSQLLTICLLFAKLRFASGQYNLNEVLQKSILFYEAQRSGSLPANNRVPWRGDSALSDRGNNGEDLTGGWYDAGDTMKFGFPMAFATTTLAWGILEFGDAYQAAGEYDNALDSIRWPLDYFIKAHPEPNLFYGQVGNADTDHGWWGRPEDNTLDRPAFSLSDKAPGSDLLGETAAALTASYLVFRDSDSGYANTLLSHARQLYALAYAYHGLYHDSIPNAANYYRSSGYNDELAWAAAWLFRATGEQAYLDQALQFVNSGATAWAYNWNEKSVGAQLLLAVHAGQTQFDDAVRRFINSYLPGGSVPYTPKGLACATDWGALAAAAGASYISLVAANYGYLPTEGRNFARSQINYILGDVGHSFVVGFGNNPPVRAHHRAESCPDRPATCDWNTYNSPEPNAQTLYGAMVSGPDCDDYWVDDRTNYQRNEVATDYNAAFQGAVAGLIALGLRD